MAVFRCKMCGGELDVQVGVSVCTCEYCGAKQTLPVVDDDAIRSLFNRANVLRMKAEFDKATDVYEKILQQKEDEAEAYWGLILCKYGIEYVEDPKTSKRIPTCHRASYDPVVTDEDYKNALRYADPFQRSIYEEEAVVIDGIQKGILTIAQKNEPYDVFICYKETDEDGRRTTDSVLANDIYHQLTQEGFKVFFAAISLEDKLGTEYEPHIFSALNTAKVMLVLGTKPEFFNAVWVKNEWSRFLQIMKKDRNKLLIPCYKGMDPYELPEEFSHLQAQDMGKIGFINDLVRGIKKILDVNKNQEKTGGEAVTAAKAGMNTSASAQLKRGDMALEDEDWEQASAFFEKALNLDPECAEAYLGKFLAQIKKSSWQEFIQEQKDKYQEADTEVLDACPKEKEQIDEIVRNNIVEGFLDEGAIRAEFEFDRHYVSSLRIRKEQKDKQSAELKSERLLARTLQYAKGETKEAVEDGLNSVNQVLDERIKKAEESDKDKIEEITVAYTSVLESATQKVGEMHRQAREHQERLYRRAMEEMGSAKGMIAYESAKNQFKTLLHYKDSLARVEECEKEIERIRDEARQKATKEWEEERKKQQKKSLILVTVSVIVVAIIALLAIVVIPNSRYKKAKTLLEAKEYDRAYGLLEALNKHKEVVDSKNERALEFLKSEDYERAYELLEEIGKLEEIKSNKYDRAQAMIKDECYEPAYLLLYGLDYQNSEELLYELKQKPECRQVMLSVAEPGSTVFYGTYEQDNDTTNGTEAVEWYVLEKKDNQLFLTSKYVLDCKPFHNVVGASVTWGSCTLRTWLNSDFSKQTFSSEELARISDPTVFLISSEGSTDDISATDKVFLLSTQEANVYFSSDKERRCAATPYAKRVGVQTFSAYYTVDDLTTCFWWLRSSGSTQERAANVGFDGSIDTKGGEVSISKYGFKMNDVRYSGGFGVRPAIWVSLDD